MIVSYSASPSRIIVLVKTHWKLLLLKGEKKTERKGNKKEMKKWTKELHATRLNEKGAKILRTCHTVAQCSSQSWMKLFKLLRWEEKRTFWGEFSLIIGSEIWYICSLSPLKNCSNRGFSGLVVAWIILEVAISLHRGFMCDFLISFICVYRTGETIYSAEHLHETQNKITRKINRIPCYMDWVQFWNAWYNKICSSAMRKVKNWNSELTPYHIYSFYL